MTNLDQRTLLSVIPEAAGYPGPIGRPPLSTARSSPPAGQHLLRRPVTPLNVSRLSLRSAGMTEGAGKAAIHHSPFTVTHPLPSPRPHQCLPFLLHVLAHAAASEVVVYEAHGLHEGVDGGGTDKAPATLLQVF